MAAGRRLQLAAEHSGVTGLLLRRWRYAAEAAAERHRPTAAVTRWRVAALPSLVEHGPLKREDAWGVTFWDRAKCRGLIDQYRNEGVFTPPDTRGTIVWPGYIGGVNWGGIAYDPRSQRVLAAVNHLAMVVTLMSIVREMVPVFKDYITLDHMEAMNKIIMTTGLMVGYAYG